MAAAGRAHLLLWHMVSPPSISSWLMTSDCVRLAVLCRGTVGRGLRRGGAASNRQAAAPSQPYLEGQPVEKQAGALKAGRLVARPGSEQHCHRHEGQEGRVGEEGEAEEHGGGAHLPSTRKLKGWEKH